MADGDADCSIAYHSIRTDKGYTCTFYLTFIHQQDNSAPANGLTAKAAKTGRVWPVASGGEFARTDLGSHWGFGLDSPAGTCISVPPPL